MNVFFIRFWWGVTVCVCLWSCLFLYPLLSWLFISVSSWVCFLSLLPFVSKCVCHSLPVFLSPTLGFHLIALWCLEDFSEGHSCQHKHITFVCTTSHFIRMFYLIRKSSFFLSFGSRQSIIHHRFWGVISWETNQGAKKAKSMSSPLWNLPHLRLSCAFPMGCRPQRTLKW